LPACAISALGGCATKLRSIVSTLVRECSKPLAAGVIAACLVFTGAAFALRADDLTMFHEPGEE
jgi:hypothetical protein